MTHDSDQLTRNTAVPTWMVWLFSALGVAAAGTIGGIVVQDRGQLHVLGNERALDRERIARVEVKQQDILDAVLSMRKDLQELSRRMP